jgi:competence protein ComEA
MRRLVAWLAPALLLAACGGSAPTLVLPTVVATTSPAPAASVASREVEVYVIGAVARPGVYSLPPDSRIQDAIAAAGGFSVGADMVRVNLAARVRDEQEIFVPKVGETIPSGLPASGVDLNSASATQLRTALGLTTTVANKIVSYRRAHGPFNSVDDLRNVPVSDADIERIRPIAIVR